jgi:VWFA-related protein
MRVGRFAGLLTAGIVAVIVAGRAWTQESPPTFGTEVRVVAVPVFVMDKDGRAVPGLTAQDFEIEDSGRVVPLAGFLPLDAGTRTEGLPSGASRRMLAASRRQFLLLFDLTFSSGPGLAKARKAALELLEKGPQPGDLIAVASFAQTGVNVLLGFSPDRVQAARAIATLGAPEGNRIRDPLGLAYDLGFVVDQTASTLDLQIVDKSKDPEFSRDQVLMLSRANRVQYGQNVAGYLAELQRFAQLLDSVDGRKQVILLSAGFDQSVIMGAQGTERATNANAVAEGRLWEVQSDSHFGDASARGVMDGVFAALTRSDTVIHTVDIGGLGDGGISLEEQASSVPKGSGRESLAEIAGRSGGRFVRDTNDLAGALRDVMDASRFYYVLAFEPVDSKKKPGELHKLKIKVKRAGLEVSHRAGYTLPDPKTVAPAASRMQAAETIAKGLSGGAIRMQAVAVPYRDAQGRVSLPVVLEIDGESLVAGGAKKSLGLEVYGYVLDGEGRIQDALALSPTLDLDKLGAGLKQKGVQVLTAFRVREGPADLRFLVRDPSSGRSGSLRTSVVVPSFQGGALVLSPPLLMDDPRSRLVIPTPSKANPELQIPFRLEDTPFTAQAAPVLRNGEARQVCLMAYGAAEANLSSSLKAALVRDGAQPVALEIGAPRVVKDADRFNRLVLSLTPKGVPAGEYRLRLTVPGTGGAESQSEVAVRVN